MPFGIGVQELLIVLVLALIILGPKRLPEVGRSIGSGMREFRDSISGGKADTVLVTCMLVRYTRCDASSKRACSRPSAPNAFTMRWPPKASAVMCVSTSSCSCDRRPRRRTRCPRRTSG